MSECESPIEEEMSTFPRFPRPSKYGNRKTIVDGITFDSAKEAKRWGELKLLERVGEITSLGRQMRYPLTVNGVKVCAYVCDFYYLEKGQSIYTVEDVKGMRTDVYKLKKKLMKACLGIEIKEI